MGNDEKINAGSVTMGLGFPQREKYWKNGMRNCILNCLTDRVVKATCFIAPNYIVRAVRRTYHGEILKRSNIEILLTIGKPNSRERDFIKQCKKVGEPFPVKKIQLKYLKVSK